MADFQDFIASVNWTEKFIAGLILAQVLFLILVIATRKRQSIQMLMIILITSLVTGSQRLNTLGREHWKRFATQNYFDPQGLFMLVFFSGPLLLSASFITLHTMKMLFDMATQLGVLLVILKFFTIHLRFQIKLDIVIARAAQRPVEDCSTHVKAFGCAHMGYRGAFVSIGCGCVLVPRKLANLNFCQRPSLPLMSYRRTHMQNESSSSNTDQIHPRVEELESIPPPVLSKPSLPSSSFNTVQASQALWSAGWTSWWVQIILTIIAATIFIFAFAFPGVSIASSANAGGLVLAAAGVAVSLISVIWTYSYTRLSLWLRSHPSAQEKGASKVAGRLQIGIRISMFGIFLSILGLQAIAGTLLARLFGSGLVTSAYVPPGSQLAPATAHPVQPIDILVVQACANALSALFTAALGSLWLKGRLQKWAEKG